MTLGHMSLLYCFYVISGSSSGDYACLEAEKGPICNAEDLTKSYSDLTDRSTILMLK
jgi:hypothetical protein